MWTFLASVLGLFSSAIPSLIDYFKQRQNNAYQLELLSMQLEAARQGLDYQRAADQLKSDSADAESARAHDTAVDGGRILNTIRASIRPFAFFTIFIFWIVVRVYAAYDTAIHGGSGVALVAAAWNETADVLLASIVSYYFGSRIFMTRYPLQTLNMTKPKK